MDCNFRRYIAKAALITFLCLPSVVWSSDAMLMEQTVDIRAQLDVQQSGDSEFPTRTLYRSKKDKNQFYYLPPDLRFALDKESRPMLTVYKYNLVYNNGNFEDIKEDIDKGEVYQGGTLKASFTMELRGNELDLLEKALKEKGISANPKIGRLPLNAAEFSITLVDPEDPDGGLILLGPFKAPVSSGLISVVAPLSKSATDILHTILTKKNEDGKTVVVPDAPINVLLSFDYTGYGLNSSINVTGDWDNVYKSSEVKSEVKANYWFVSGSAAYEDKKSKLMQDAKIKIVVDGDVSDEDKERVRSDVMTKVLEQAFDLGGLEPAPEDSLDADAGKAPDGEGGTLFGKPVGVNVGFAMKAVSKQKTGKIDYAETGYMRINRPDARYAKLDMSNVDPERNVMVVEPSDWSVARVMAEVSGDVEPFFLQKSNGEARPQMVSMTYGTQVSRQTFPKPITPGGDVVDFGPFPNGGDPMVEVNWTLPFAPWPQVKEDLGLFDNKLAPSWSAAQNIMRKVYAKKGPPSFTTKGDLRLMSSISLTKSMLPLTPDLANITVQVTGPDSGLIDWFKEGNVIPMMIEQKIKGVKKPHRIPLGAPLKLEGPYTISFEPIQAIILTGPDVESSKLVATAISVNKDGGGRVTKRNVVLMDDLLNGGFVDIDIEKALK